MREFFRDVGFRIVDHWALSVIIAGLVVVIGLLLAYTALRNHAAMGEYRVLAVVVGLAFAVGSVVAVPLLRAQAHDACDEWGRSADPAAQLNYVRHDCAGVF